MSGRKCRHAITADKYGETTHDHDGMIVYEVEYRECLDCGAWLPLGPARDTPDEVRVEIRAAEIAANARAMFALSHNHSRSYMEHCGWRGIESIDGLVVQGKDGTRRVENGVPLNLDHVDWLAGYLAREIAEGGE